MPSKNDLSSLSIKPKNTLPDSLSKKSVIQTA